MVPVALVEEDEGGIEAAAFGPVSDHAKEHGLTYPSRPGDDQGGRRGFA